MELNARGILRIACGCLELISSRIQPNGYSLELFEGLGGGLGGGLGRGLAVVSSSGQLRSMSGLVDLGIQVYCCEISDFKGTLHLKSMTEFYKSSYFRVKL